jgi:hypothetical protein
VVGQVASSHMSLQETAVFILPYIGACLCSLLASLDAQMRKLLGF